MGGRVGEEEAGEWSGGGGVINSRLTLRESG